MEVDWDSKISDYFQNGCWNLPHYFQSRFRNIAEEVKNVDIKPGHMDKLIWKKNLQGQVTSKNAFFEYTDHAPKVLWGKWLWAEFIPPRRSILAWRIIHNAIPTMDNLRLKGIQMASVCTLCLKNNENADHTFTRCPILHPVWNHFADLLNLKFDLQGGFNNLLVQLMRLNVSPSLMAVVKSFFMAIIWTIWETRNNHIHKNRKPYIPGMISTIWSSINNLKHFKMKGFNGSQEELQIANNFQIQFSCVQRMRIKEVHWNLPPPNWVKINVDGSAKGAPGNMISAGVFRNCRGFVKGCFVANTGVGYAIEAEIWAAVIAIEKAEENNWRRIWIESDSMIVVQLLKCKSKIVPWTILPRWLHCLHILNHMDVCISHINREGNQAADHLTSISEYSFHWWYQSPDFLWPFISKDIQQRPYFRFY